MRTLLIHGARATVWNAPDSHLAVQKNFPENPSVMIIFTVLRVDDLAGDGIGQVFFGFRAECLSPFGCVYARQPDHVLDLASVEHHDGATVGDPDDAASEGVSE